MPASGWPSFRFRLAFIACGVVAAALAVAAVSPVFAQEDRIRPVTDAELENPSPGDWLMWRRTLNGWGYSPLDQVDRDNVAGLQMVWSRALAPGRQQGTPLVRDGVLFMPNPQRRHPGHRRGDRRPDLGVPPRPPGRPGRVHDRQPDRDQPQHRHPRRADHRHDDGRPHRRPARGDGRGRVGHRDPRLPGEPGQPDLGADRRRREGVLGPELRPARRAPRLRHRRARRGDRRGAVAPAADSGAGRVRRRDVGRRAVRGARARRLVDGAERRPGAEPGLRRHVGHVAGAEVHAGRGRQEAPLPQLDAGFECGHRRDRVVLPAPERQLGPRPPVRTVARRHGGAAGSVRGELDKPAAEPGRGAPRADRHPGQDRRRLHPGPGDRGVPVGHADHHPERDQRHRRGDRSRDGERGTGLHRAGPDGAGLPARQRREGLGGRRLQSPDQHHVHAVAERLRADAGQHLRRRAGQPALRDRVAQPDRAGDRPSRRGARDLRGDRGHHLDVRATGRHHGPRRDRRRAGVRGRRQRPVPRVRPHYGGDPLGDQPRLAGLRVPGHLRGRRPAVRGGRRRHRPLPGADAGAAPEQRQQPVRVRALPE